GHIAPRRQLPFCLRTRRKNLMNAITSDPVGIIGAGRLGQAMARTALRAGRQVVIANSRGPESLASVVSTLGEGAAAGTGGGAAGEEAALGRSAERPEAASSSSRCPGHASRRRCRAANGIVRS